MLFCLKLNLTWHFYVQTFSGVYGMYWFSLCLGSCHQTTSESWMLNTGLCLSQCTVPDVPKPPSGQLGHASRFLGLQTLTASWTISWPGSRKTSPWEQGQAATNSTKACWQKKCLHSNNLWIWAENCPFLLPANHSLFSLLTCFTLLGAIQAVLTSCPAEEGSALTPEKSGRGKQWGWATR